MHAYMQKSHQFDQFLGVYLVHRHQSYPIPKWKLNQFFIVLAASYYLNAEEQRPRSPSAIVIGGGFAGIAAAYALKNASFKVSGLLLNSPFRYFKLHISVIVWKLI